MQQFQSTLPQREWQAVGGGKPYVINISIHTPTKGVTLIRQISLIVAIHFNPHSHKGSDIANLTIPLNTTISIHTPTKGVTLKIQCQQLWDTFQSTLPQREWHDEFVKHQQFSNFNPHSHKGSDEETTSNAGSVLISIHTPTKGVTSGSHWGFPGAGNFNPHSHKGSDTVCADYWCPVRHFNPHSHKGSDSNFVQFRTFIF